MHYKVKLQSMMIDALLSSSFRANSGRLELEARMRGEGFLCAQDPPEDLPLCIHNASTSLLIIVLTSGKISTQTAFPLGKSEKCLLLAM